jgi:class 3 adenylate cyclase/tetratricopeptide (TPR) repeat protein
VTCPGCAHEVPAAAKFCPECGAPQTPGGARPERDPRSYTPKYLSDKILASKSALEGERKQVTVMFVDVRGSMELAASVDAEEWHRILERFFEILAAGVHRFEGTVNQYTGDGIMALFGAPIAHEDHAQRACYAALHLREELGRYADELRLGRGLDFATRTGIHSGEVVVGRIGDDLRMDYTAQGQVVGFAARLQEIAGANRACISAETARIVGGYFALRDLGEARLKGVTAPVRVFQLEGLGPLRSRLDVSRARGLSKFVGRAAEMAVLEASLERATAEQGQIVGIVAEPGVGKSRLCFEFAERCRARGVLVRVAHGVAHGKAVPLLPVLELYRAAFGIEAKDSERTARQKIAGFVVGLDESLVSSLPLLYDFLGVPDPEKPVSIPPGPERQRRLLALLQRLTVARGRREPAVLLFEDLHWIDDATAAFVENLVATVEVSRTLMLVNFRPEFRAEWTSRPDYRPLALEPLGEPALLEMLADLLGSDSSLGGLAERIHSRTAGNPFFAEEIVQSLVESGALEGSRGGYRLTRPSAELELPPSVRVVLAARIDRLGEREKSLLQAASVIGRDFSESLVRSVCDLDPDSLGAALRTLVEGEFIHETALYPEAEYQFKHPLTQEVAYESQLREPRGRVHAAVARGLAEIHAARLDENAALLAQHWEAAGDPAEAARWHRRAAEWIAVRDPAESLAHWSRVSELLAPLAETAETLGLRATALAQIVFNGARAMRPEADLEAAFQEGMDLARRADNARAEALLLIGRAILRMSYSSGDAEYRRALALAEQAGDVPLQLAAGAYVANLGGPRDGLALTERLIALAGGDVRAGAELLGNSPCLHLYGRRIGWLVPLGRLRDAERARDRALELVERYEDPMSHARVLWWSATLADALGDAPRMLREALRAHEIAPSNHLLLRFETQIVLLAAHLANGDLEAAARVYDARLDRFDPRMELAASHFHLARGDTESAVRAVAWAGRVASPSIDAPARLQRARARLAAEGASVRAAVESDLAGAAQEIDAFGLELHRPELHELRAELARVCQDEAGRERELREARRLYLEMGATAHAERVQAALRI